MLTELRVQWCLARML